MRHAQMLEFLAQPQFQPGKYRRDGKAEFREQL
jgi:hypothetical protein